MFTRDIIVFWSRRNPAMSGLVNMILKRRLTMTLAIASFIGVAVLRADIAVITPEGSQLAAFLDSLQVQHHWLAGDVVNWQTGATGSGISTNMTGNGTHCSTFAPAAATLLGIYLLHPPQHSWVLLANAQEDWLLGGGTNSGWIAIPQTTTNGVVAQSLANQGNLVVVTYKNPDTNSSGHIAIIHPYINTVTNILAVGAEECQAGAHNDNLTNISYGFNQHPGAFPSGLYYFYHLVTYPITPANPVLTNVTISNGILHCKVSSVVGRDYQLQITTNFVDWTTALTYTNPNNLTTFTTTANLSSLVPQVCSLGVQVTDPYGIASQVVTQSQNATYIILNGTPTMSWLLGTPFVDPGAIGLENCSIGLAVTTNGSVNQNVVGTYTLTYRATPSTGGQLVATRTVNVVAVISSYETNINAAHWSETFDEINTNGNALLPGGWVFGQGTSLPIYNAPLNAPVTFSTSTPTNFTLLSADQNSRVCVRSYDGVNGGSAPVSGSRVNFGDQVSGGTNRAVGFMSSSPSWISPTNYVMFGFINQTGSNIVSVALNFNYKRYSSYAATGAAASLLYSYDGSNWNAQPGAGAGPYSTNTGHTYFFTSGSQVTNELVTITNVSVLNNFPFYLCWKFVIANPDGKNSQMLALDDFNMDLTLTKSPSTSVVPPPRLQNISFAGGALSFSWSTVIGASYQVQFCTHLVQPDWTNLGSSIVATNTSMGAADSQGAISSRFYRIVLAVP